MAAASVPPCCRAAGWWASSGKLPRPVGMKQESSCIIGRVMRADNRPARKNGRSDRRERNPMNRCKVWVERCQAAKASEDEFGTQKALTYPVGEKFLNHLEAAEQGSTFQAALPAVVAVVKRLFGPWQPAECLETAGHPEPFDAGTYEEVGPEVVGTGRQADLRRRLAGGGAGEGVAADEQRLRLPVPWSGFVH